MTTADTDFTGEDLPDMKTVVLVLDDLNDRLAALERPSCWPDPEVKDWVEGWLIPVFELGSQLEGWEEKPSWVSELSALHYAYREALVKGQAGAFGPLQWHSEKEAMLMRLDTYRARAAGRATRLSFKN